MQEKTKEIRIIDEHVRAARALLRWTLDDLASKSGIDRTTLHRWESNKHKPTTATREAVKKAFEEAGIEFTNGSNPGVKHIRRPEA
jgi:transcriptional regulator with XRE-family HTH domain